MERPSAASPAPEAGATNASASGDLLELLDGSSLHGELEAIDHTGGIRWRHPAALAPIQLRPTNLGRIQFTNPKPLALPFEPRCRFWFRNGDDLAGNLLALDGENVVMDTWFGRALSVPRNALHALSPQRVAVVYDGPTGPEGWSMGQGMQPWEYRDGSFVAQGHAVLGRDFKLTDSASIEFELTWTGQFTLIVPVFTETVDRLDYSKSSYSFHIVPGTIMVQRVQASPNGITISSLGRQEQVPQMTGKRRVRFQLRVDKEESVMEALADGEPVGKWKDDRGFIAKGGGILFYAQPVGATLAVSRVRVCEWKGRQIASGAAQAQEDTLHLINRDKVEGSLRGLRDGKLSFAANQTELTIPLERVSQIFFASGPAAPRRASEWETRAELFGGGTLTFELESWSGSTISGRSDHFGLVTFDSQYVQQLVFNRTAPAQAIDSRVGAVVWPPEEDAPGSKSPEPGAGRGGATAASARFVFRNGDSLRGELRGIEPARTVVLERADALRAVELRPASLAEIQFGGQQPAPANGTNAGRVRLINGDELEGAMLSVDTDSIVLETEAAGKLAIPRAMTDTIRPLTGRRAMIFAGPTGMQGWTAGKINTVPDAGQWSYKEGAFYATRAASIARDLQLPDVASIQFDLAWKGMLQEAIALYTSYLQPINLVRKDEEPEFGGFYSLQLHGSGAYVIAVQQNQALRNLEMAPVPLFGQQNQAHVEVRVNRPRRQLALLVNGELVKQWTDTEFAGTGTGIRFVHQGVGAIKWSNLSVSEWDGQFEEPPGDRADRKQDLAKLRNGDQVSGNVETIRDGRMVITIDGSKPLSIPLDRVTQIELAAKKTARLPDQAVNVRGFLRNQQQVAFLLERWDKNGVTGSHPLLGKVRFEPAAFERVEFLQR